MNIRFTIAIKLGIGFGVIAILILASYFQIFRNLNANRKIADANIQIYTPSVSELNNLYVMVSNSKMLIKNWVYIERKEDTKDKQQLKKLHQVEFGDIKKRIQVLSESWDTSYQREFNEICKTVEDTLFKKHKYIMDGLSNFTDYDNAMVFFDITPMVEENGEVIRITDQVLEKLNKLLDNIRIVAKEANTQMTKSFDDFKTGVIAIASIIIIISFFIALAVISSIVRPINRLKAILMYLSQGILPDYVIKVSKDEIGDMASALNSYVNSLKVLSEFSVEIGKGNFKSDFTPLSDQDILGNSLIEMRKNLQLAAEKELARKKEDDHRNWGTVGLARFADILRKNNDDLHELAYDIISNLVKYLGANQGGMFIVNDDEKEDIKLELYAAYAYERKKYMKKTVQKGEGIVGTCYLEKKTIFMVDIPDSYLHITSGLGKANPRCLLVVPLKMNEEIFGIIEIASFKRFEKFQIEFVEKVGESIASTISNVKINTRTAKLLKESKEQSEQLIQHEEEMRQNLEELQSTQEEASRKISELEGFTNAIVDSVGYFELDFDGTINFVNDFLCRILNAPADQFIGKNHQVLIIASEDPEENYQRILIGLKKGIPYKADHAYNTLKGRVWLSESYIAVKNNYGQFSKIMVFVSDITTYKN